MKTHLASSISGQSNSEDSHPVSNGWENLVPRLHPAILDAAPHPKFWQRVDRVMVSWLLNVANKTPWLNPLALMGMVIASNEPANLMQYPWAMDGFLGWAIPDHYPDLASLKPNEALETYFGNPLQTRGRVAHRAYSAVQFQVTHYLESLPPQKRTALIPFLLPPLKPSRRLSRMSVFVEERAKQGRKERGFAVVKTLPHLIALGRRRYRWLAELDRRVQQVFQSVQAGQTTLPQDVVVKGLDGHETLTFRVWDRSSWIEAHLEFYTRSALWIARKETQPSTLGSGFFLQLVGEIPKENWFLNAIALRLIQGTPRATPEAKQYVRDWKLPDFAWAGAPGILTPSDSLGLTLGFARRAVLRATGKPTILFCVEPLLIAAAIGQFALISIVSTGMRLGELQQVTLDHDCIEEINLPQFDEKTSQWTEGPKQLYWKLYPKGHQQRERFFVSKYMLEAMFTLLALHQRFYGEESIKPLRSSEYRGFRHCRRFRGKHRFVLQWSGRQIPDSGIQLCLAFLLLEYACVDAHGTPVHITPHILRHGVAGWLRNQGVPLEEIMGLLKQVNIEVTDYYSKLSPEDLHQKIGPALTALAEIAELDPATIRTVDEIKNLAQAALLRYGILRQTPGGVCTSFQPCEVQFKCAGCASYCPDPARRDEVQDKITCLTKGIQLFRELGDYLTADVEKSHLRDWERILKEVDELAKTPLVLPADRSLQSLETDDLGNSLLESLAEIHSLSAGKESPCPS